MFYVFESKPVHFYFTSETEKEYLLFLFSHTTQVKGGYAAALFLTLTLLLTPIETVCQSNYAPS